MTRAEQWRHDGLKSAALSRHEKAALQLPLRNLAYVKRLATQKQEVSDLRKLQSKHEYK